MILASISGYACDCTLALSPALIQAEVCSGHCLAFQHEAQIEALGGVIVIGARVFSRVW